MGTRPVSYTHLDVYKRQEYNRFKKYDIGDIVGVEGEVFRTQRGCLLYTSGITLGDGLECLPAKLEILKSDAQSVALITIREGKFHQIKRMLASRGKPVVYLKRLSMGPLTLDEGLSRGEYLSLIHICLHAHVLFSLPVLYLMCITLYY